jgi:dTMP kinase
MARSLFISFEGPEGAGKTTQVKLLQSSLVSAGHDVLVTRQPGGEPVGAQLRKIMLDVGHETVHPRAELLLMMADRAQSVETIIRPHLSRGGTVICDRYADSSIAYQGGGREIDLTAIDWLNSFATSGLQPDITFLLELDPAVGLNRQQEITKMEREALAFHNRVREAYLAIAVSHPRRVKVVDAVQSVDKVEAAIWAVVKQYHKTC